MWHMSNLHCPNCAHLIGTLKLADAPADQGARDVSTWKAMVGWEGWLTSGELFQLYSKWAAERGLQVPTQRIFTAVLLDTGATWKRSNRGRLYTRS